MVLNGGSRPLALKIQGPGTLRGPKGGNFGIWTKLSVENGVFRC